MPTDPAHLTKFSSEHNSFDSSPWIKGLVDFTRKALAHPRVRVIGVCFGHQIVGRALAGDKAVGRNDKGWEAAVNEVTLTSKGKELFGGRDVLVSLIPLFGLLAVKKAVGYGGGAENGCVRNDLGKS